jgi:hypothetical protein
MSKDFNKDLDQTDGDKRRETAKENARRTQVEPSGDAEAARKRAGEGFKGAGDEYAESGSRGAGYRETKPDKK